MPLSSQLVMPLSMELVQSLLTRCPMVLLAMSREQARSSLRSEDVLLEPIVVVGRTS